MYDVVIIGGGISGAACARELSRYHGKILLIDKEEDICCGTTKANSAIIHAGYDAKEGSLMAKLNVLGNKMLPELSKELDFEFSQRGSFVVCTDPSSLHNLDTLEKRAEANGVPVELITDKERFFQMEPNLSPDTIAVLYAPTAGIVCPFNMNFALAENAYANGVEFAFNTCVTGFEKKQDSWIIKTNKDDIETKVIVNAAGVFADELNNMVSDKKINITPRRGEYFLLDKSAGSHVTRTIFALPTALGKGVLITPTVHGNMLVGPTADDISDKNDVGTSAHGIGQINIKAGMNVANLNLRQVITSFSGLRAHEDGHEFIIGEAEGAEGFINCAGIESPGLSSAPAIGVMVADIVSEKLSLEKKADFNGSRKGIINPAHLTKTENIELIKTNPSYSNIICRCEMITEGEIIDAVTRPLGARSLDGVKRRTRAGMGRCQGGFCSPRVMEIISRECGIPISEITKMGGNSKIIVGTNKDSL